MRIVFLLFSIFALLALAGCSGPAAQLRSDAKLVFVAHLSMDPDGQARFRVGVRNVGSQAFLEDKHFNGLMEIQGPEGKLRSRAEMPSMSRIEPGKEELPAGLLARIDPGSYMLILRADNQETLQVPFEILVRNGLVYLQAESSYLNPMTPFTLSSDAGTPTSMDIRQFRIFSFPVIVI